MFVLAIFGPENDKKNHKKIELSSTVSEARYLFDERCGASGD